MREDGGAVVIGMREAEVQVSADDLMVCCARAEVEPGICALVRVEKVGAEYWAFWGVLSACATGEAGVWRERAHASAKQGWLAA